MTAGSFSLASARVAEMSLQRELRALGADITLSLEQLDAPISLADAAGFVRWQNAAAIELVGDKRGTRFTSMAPDYVQQTRASLARRSMGADPISYETTVVLGADGERKRIKLIVLSLVSGTEFVGVLNIVKEVVPDGGAAPGRLTPRQNETLHLLAAGLTTEQIAERLGVSRETARNYIRRLLRALGVHSRLEAVVRGREDGLI
ncbi:MAG: helix-turn-helix transcriptional regulator [Actinobacteria bacterium]|nr:MAG: helix-turn-helix transcriptional regulator [Actinomycetota bacterium]